MSTEEEKINDLLIEEGRALPCPECGYVIEHDCGIDIEKVREAIEKRMGEWDVIHSDWVELKKELGL